MTTTCKHISQCTICQRPKKIFSIETLLCKKSTFISSQSKQRKLLNLHQINIRHRLRIQHQSCFFLQKRLINHRSILSRTLISKFSRQTNRQRVYIFSISRSTFLSLIITHTQIHKQTIIWYGCRNQSPVCVKQISSFRINIFIFFLQAIYHLHPLLSLHRNNPKHTPTCRSKCRSNKQIHYRESIYYRPS